MNTTLASELRRPIAKLAEPFFWGTRERGKCSAATWLNVSVHESGHVDVADGVEALGRQALRGVEREARVRAAQAQVGQVFA